jgi:hypothetical protein
VARSSSGPARPGRARQPFQESDLAGRLMPGAMTTTRPYRQSSGNQACGGVVVSLEAFEGEPHQED